MPFVISKTFSFSLSGLIPSRDQIAQQNTWQMNSVARKAHPIVFNLSSCSELSLASQNMPYSPLLLEQEQITLPEGDKGLVSMVIDS